MKNFKTVISLLICLSLVFVTLTTTTMAATLTTQKIDKASIDSIMKKYNLTEVPIGKKPTNIKPLEVKSAADLDKIFSTMATPSSVTVEQGYSSTTPGQIQPMATGSAVHSTYVFSPYAYYNIRANYRYEYDYAHRCNYYAQIYGVSSDMTGFTQWIDYSADTSLSYGLIVNNGLGLKAHCEGTVYYYLLINGLWRLWSGHEVQEWTFTNP